ncbi:DUF6207 family protein [Streptomyces sp. NPDC059814]|uniref:DUF6207 family protein n=1 Tax=Streptomyces sp. NPDC059814 TaxID=3346959 RepID=UPI003651DDF7
MTCTVPMTPAEQSPRQKRHGDRLRHIAEPGLVVLDMTAADENTAHAVMATQEQR